MSFDPFRRTKRLKKIVCKRKKRKYYRFRKTQFYGGCATADTVGCNLNCAYCFVNKPRKKPREVGKFYEPSEVIEKLLEMEQERLRITGGEPTLCREHLEAVLEEIPKDKTFILETNGLLLGKHFDYVKSVAKGNVLVRVSLKGISPESFEKITSADPQAFKYQLQALENLKDAGADYRAAIIPRLFKRHELKSFLRKIVSIDPSLFNKIEFESLKKYPHVKEEMKERGVELKW